MKKQILTSLAIIISTNLFAQYPITTGKYSSQSSLVIYQKYSAQFAKTTALDKQLKEKEKSLKGKSGEEISKMEAELETLRTEYDNAIKLRNELQKDYNTAIIVNNEMKFFIPIRHSYQAEPFYRTIGSLSSFDIVNNIVVQGQSDMGTIYSELVSGNLKHVRIGLGTLVAASRDTSTEMNSLQTLLGGGGNAMLNLYYPIAYKKKDWFTFYWQLQPKFAGQLPVLGSYSDNVTGNFQFGTDFYIDFSTDGKEFTFYCLLRTAKIWGTDDFYTNLGISDKKSFSFTQINFGVGINESWRISFSTPLTSSEDNLLKFPVMIGTQFIPKNKRS